MRSLFSLCLLLLSCSIGFAQQGQRTITTINLSTTTDKQLIEGELPYQDILPFFSYFIDSPQGAIDANIRFSEDQISWTNWTKMDKEIHEVENYITQLYYGEAKYKYYQLSIDQTKTSVSDITLHFFNPGKSKENTSSNNPTQTPSDLLACPCTMPEFENRNDWCSTSECPEHSSPSLTSVTHLIVHHSAGPNTSSDWAATVRSIWDFHVNGRGWSDIGYNWLIDPNGVLYQGREDNVQGAHFCAHNSRTMGVCVMGTFTDVTPTTTAINSLEALLAWKSCNRSIAPLESSYHSSTGFTIPNISGHRDGCATECPGNSFYPTLPDVRQGVVDYIESNCTAVGINQLELDSDLLSISPNPTKNQLSIHFESELTGDMQWQLVNLYQQVVLQWDSSKRNTVFTDKISIDKLAAGIYFLHLEINGQKGMWKFIKA